MTVAAITFVLGLMLGAGGSRVKWRRSPINQVAGMLMPHPSDERWKLAKHDREWGPNFMAYHLGAVRCDSDGELFIDGVKCGYRGHVRYVRAVFHAQGERKALAAALDS